jgi:trehalose 2-sulfotransferase
MANILISEKHRRELSPERDFPAKTPVRRRYCILSSPRSGSTLLGRFLYETRMAGDPQEYFNPPLLVLERQRSGDPKLSLNEFLRVMEERRTSPNGVFGMKMHYSQLLGVLRVNKPDAKAVAFMKKFGKLIWIRRRDRIGQGISQAIALRTQVWSTEDSRFERDPAVDIHPFECVKALHAVCRDDAGWDQLISAAKLGAHEIWYEDLVADYEAQCRSVLAYLELERDVSKIPPQPIERQAGELNERLRRELVAYFGLSNAGR